MRANEARTCGWYDEDATVEATSTCASPATHYACTLPGSVPNACEQHKCRCVQPNTRAERFTDAQATVISEQRTNEAGPTYGAKADCENCGGSGKWHDIVWDEERECPCVSGAAMQAPRSQEAMRVLAQKVLESQKVREGEDVDAWAERLAADSVAAGDQRTDKPRPDPPWLDDLLEILGWQGGTIHDALRAVRALRAICPPAYLLSLQTGKQRAANPESAEPVQRPPCVIEGCTNDHAGEYPLCPEHLHGLIALMHHEKWEDVTRAYLGGQRGVLREIAEMLGMAVDPDPAVAPQICAVVAFVTAQRPETATPEEVMRIARKVQREERAAVVKWLRGAVDAVDDEVGVRGCEGARVVRHAADAIERGDHVPTDEEGNAT